MFIIIIAYCSWHVTRYVILLHLFNTVCFGYLRYIFVDFIGFLSTVIQIMLIYIATQYLRYNICSAWFLDIRIPTCSCKTCKILHSNCKTCTKNEAFRARYRNLARKNCKINFLQDMIKILQEIIIAIFLVRFLQDFSYPARKASFLVQDLQF